MTPIEVLNLALEKEKEAYEFYKKIGIEHAAIRDLCEDLTNEEYKHRKLIEKKIVELSKY